MVLRKHCGWHNVYQVDDYEFAVLFPKKMTAEKMRHVLEQETAKLLFTAGFSHDV